MSGLCRGGRDMTAVRMILQCSHPRIIRIFFAVWIGCCGCLMTSPVIQHLRNMEYSLLCSLPSLCQHFRYTAQYQIIVLGTVKFRTELQAFQQFTLHYQKMTDIVIAEN